MTHWRETVRTDGKARILAANTAAETRVYAERITRLATRRADEFPCVCIYVPRSTGRRGSDTMPFDTGVDIVVAVFATGVADDTRTAEEVAADAREALCAEVESALLGDGAWATACGFSRVMTLDTTSQFAEAEIVIAYAEMRLVAELSDEILPTTEPGPLSLVTLTNDNVVADEVVDTYDEIVTEEEPAP